MKVSVVLYNAHKYSPKIQNNNKPLLIFFKNLCLSKITLNNKEYYIKRQYRFKKNAKYLQPIIIHVILAKRLKFSDVTFIHPLLPLRDLRVMSAVIKGELWGEGRSLGLSFRQRM